MSKSKKFCELLSEMIESSQKTKIAFYTELGIKKAYFYDIISGKVNPPPPAKQFKIVKILNPDKDTRNRFFELAGEERNEMPADLMYYMDKNLRNKIRDEESFKNNIEQIIEEKAND